MKWRLKYGNILAQNKEYEKIREKTPMIFACSL